MNGLPFAVLLVEDNKLIQLATVKILTSKLDIKVDTVTTGEKALKHFKDDVTIDNYSWR